MEPVESNFSRLPDAFQPSTIRISALGDGFLSAMGSQLPDCRACQPLLESFLRCIHPVMPVCHVPILEQQYADFWTYLSPNASVESLSLYSLFFLYTGAANTSP